MELRCWSSAPKSNTLPLPPIHTNFCIYSPPNSSSPKCATVSCSLKLGPEDIAAIAHNKVLIAAGVSAAIGQLSKPFTRQLLYGKDFDFMATIQAGGFPSTHSSSVVAAATSLALERGFSDSIFGLTVVYAGLIMYDAQGVRREVGNHARALNNVITKTQVTWKVVRDRDELIDSSQRRASTMSEKGSSSPLLRNEESTFVPNSTSLEPGNKRGQTSQLEVSSSVADVEEEEVPNIPSQFKESIGHTEVEVIAGAFLGFLVSIAVYSVL